MKRAEHEFEERLKRELAAQKDDGSKSSEEESSDGGSRSDGGSETADSAAGSSHRQGQPGIKKKVRIPSALSRRKRLPKKVKKVIRRKDVVVGGLQDAGRKVK